jgi:hypothetical protein
MTLFQGHSVASESKSKPKRVATAIFTASAAPGIVKARVVKLRGVIRARVDAVTDTVWVEYNPTLVTEQTIKEACSSDQCGTR